MAEGADSPDTIQPAIERYSAIEQAYRDQAWSTVLEEGNALLRDLSGEQDRISAGLRQRLLLLLGHTHLHGFGDSEAARDCYGVVLTNDAEPSLQRIAEEGLQQCDLPLEPDPPSQKRPVEVQPEPALEPGQAPAMPWLESTGVHPLIPEVVDEPELIELHQANPALAEEVELKLRLPGGGHQTSEPRKAAAEAEEEPQDQDLLRGLLRVVLA